MYVERELKRTMESALEQFPAVLLVGPRQSGKTTFVQREFGDRFAYASLDDPLQRAFAREDPNGFLGQFGDEPLILDEIQHEPELLTYLKMRIDDDRERYGRWLLTGSQQFSVMSGVSESLAGRVAILELPPLSMYELGEHKSLAELCWTGLYPEPALAPDKRDLWARAYVETYIQRDVRQLTRVQDLAAFETFLGILAALHGQELNMASLSRQSGLTIPTVKSWIGLLEASFIVTRLQPYSENLGKRLVKRPKVFFLDPALPGLLTRQSTPDSLLAGPMAGAFLEGLVLSEVWKAAAAAGKRPAVWHWRSRDGLEVDLILERSGRLVPVEVKLTATPRPTNIRALSKFKEIAGERADGGLLVCRVDQERPLPYGLRAQPWQQFPAWLRSSY